MRNRVCFSFNSFSGCILSGFPPHETGIIHFVFLVIAFSTSSASMLYVDKSTSTNTGFAPTHLTTFPVAGCVKSGTITSSPCLTFRTLKANSKAVVQLFVATAYSTPVNSTTLVSNSLVIGPSVSQPESSTFLIILSSSLFTTGSINLILFLSFMTHS